MILEYPGVTGSGEIWLDVMRAICGDTSNMSMVDLMCHHAPYTSQLGFKERTYVDMLDRGLDNKEEQKFFVKKEVCQFIAENIGVRQWDIAICSDGIEHLHRATGEWLLRGMDKISHMQVIFTPTRDKMLFNNDDPDSHKSSWSPDEFKGCIVVNFPNFHPALDMGAFFSFSGWWPEIEFERVKSELNNKVWAK